MPENSNYAWPYFRVWLPWHSNHAKGRTANLTTSYYVQEVALSVAFELVSKTETYLGKKKENGQRKAQEQADKKRMVSADAVVSLLKPISFK